VTGNRNLFCLCVRFCVYSFDFK